MHTLLPPPLGRHLPVLVYRCKCRQSRGDTPRPLVEPAAPPSPPLCPRALPLCSHLLREPQAPELQVPVLQVLIPQALLQAQQARQREGLPEPLG